VRDANGFAVAYVYGRSISNHSAIIKTTKDCDTAAEMVVEYILKVINPRE